MLQRICYWPQPLLSLVCDGSRRRYCRTPTAFSHFVSLPLSLFLSFFPLPPLSALAMAADTLRKGHGGPDPDVYLSPANLAYIEPVVAALKVSPREREREREKGKTFNGNRRRLFFFFSFFFSSLPLPLSTALLV